MKHRLLRVNELLKRELSTIITREMNFEGVLVTLNQVDVTPDLKHAHAYVSVLGGKEGQTAAMAKLDTKRQDTACSTTTAIYPCCARTISTGRCCCTG